MFAAIADEFGRLDVLINNAGVAEATVYGERNPITGQIVCADVTPSAELDEEGAKRLAAEVKRHCRARLRSYQVPLRVKVVGSRLHTDRFKKARR